MEVYISVKCQNQRGGRTCGNILCKRMGNLLLMKRHGRSAEMVTTKEHPVIITCERCGEQTIVEREEE